MTAVPQFGRRALLAAPAILAWPARAQDFPTKPVRILVPFAPGGFTDVLGRFIGDRLSQALGQPVVVENKPGAGGNIAAEVVVKGPADGYTLILGSVSVFAINRVLYAKLSYDPDELGVIAVVAAQPNILLAWSGLGVRTVAELIAAAKAKPGAIAYGSFGVGSVAHLTSALFAAEAGIDVLHVPYRGSTPAEADLITGRIQMLFDGGGSAMPHIQAGNAIPLGVSTIDRLADLPDIPPIADTLPGFDMPPWFGLAGHAGTPPAVMARLRDEVGRILHSEPYRRFLRDRQANLVTAALADLPAFLAAERIRWAKAVRQSGATVE